MTKKFCTVILFAVLVLVNQSCKKAASSNEAVDLASTSAAKAAEPNFNLEAILRGEGDGFGLIKFRQDVDPSKIIILETWVHKLLPNHDYRLQRAVDTNLDGICTGTAWLTLGKGLTPQAISTDGDGTAKVELWRDVSTIPSGSTFDIHFRIIDAISLNVVLSSDCYQYTVR